MSRRKGTLRAAAWTTDAKLVIPIFGNLPQTPKWLVNKNASRTVVYNYTWTYSVPDVVKRSEFYLLELGGTTVITASSRRCVFFGWYERYLITSLYWSVSLENK